MVTPHVFMCVLKHVPRDRHSCKLQTDHQGTCVHTCPPWSPADWPLPVTSNSTATVVSWSSPCSLHWQQPPMPTSESATAGLFFSPRAA